MKYLAILLLFTALAVFGWPYLYLWRLDGAVAAQDIGALSRLVDLPALRSQVKENFQREVDDTVGHQGGRVTRWLKQGLQVASDKVIDASMDMQWVMDTLRTRPGDPPTPRASLLDDVSYAFWESTDSFLVRLGALDAEPMHIRLERQDDLWRVVAIYGP